MLTETKFYSDLELIGLDPTQIPKHVALIPDGNRRWARRHNATLFDGHGKGGENIINFMCAARELGIEQVTIYLFSTENWSRSREEVETLMLLINQLLIGKREVLLEEGIRVQTIGDLTRLSPLTQQLIEEVKQLTAHNTQIEMIVALNYGSRQELCRAVKRMLSSVERGEFTKEDVTEETLAGFLDTAQWPDPDLLIRSSGERRISNFLLWQLSYTEIYFTDTLWPDFTIHQLLDAVRYYQTRDRRLGGGVV